MKRTALIRRFLISSLLFFLAPGFVLGADSLDPETIKATMKKSADWHLENPVEWIGLTQWHMAPYYNGLLALARASGDSRYLAAVIERGERAGWAAGARTYHADDHAVGYAWFDVYNMDPEKEYRLDPMKERLDYVTANPVRKRRWWQQDRTSGDPIHWDWCDALYMAPPTLARLARITGDQKYLRFMDIEYRKAYDVLYDKEERLFYRDERFLDVRTPKGEKVFWSRGNGWVYGGLALVLGELEEKDISRKFYEHLFVEMSEKVASLQNENGLWWPSLLDESHVPSKETSGSAFFIYGMAWGVNNGLLDRETYWPLIVKGWNGLLECVHDNGMVGFVQPVGASPEDNISADSTQSYGIGAFLKAGSEILKTLSSSSPRSDSELYTEAQAMLDNRSLLRTSGAYYVPRRADDIAWENDKVAFRIYGPALKKSVEDSGVDVWMKRVDYPIIYKWYNDDFAGKASYHEDTGEGYDAYKVGATRGCGGTGIWYNGKLYTANTYESAGIRNTKEGRAALVVRYHYDIEGGHIFETKTILLREGSYLCDAKSFLLGDPDLIPKIKLAVGLVSQGDSASVVSEDGALSKFEEIDGYWLATGVTATDPDGAVETQTVPGSPGDTVLLLDLDQYQRAYYSFGFAWERHSDFVSHAAWREYLSRHKNTIEELRLNADPESHPRFWIRRNGQE